MDDLCCSVASAPGKVILFGEHAVVYGMTAVAGAVSDLRIYVTASMIEEQELEISLPDLESRNFRGSVLTSWEISQLSPIIEALSNNEFLPVPQNADLHAAFQNLSHEFAGEILTALVPIIFLSASIMFSFMIKNEHHVKGLKIEAKSHSLPVGAGLGSSAALCVAVSSALLRLRAKCYPSETFDSKVIDDFAYSAETLIHGNPSGLDNTVSCHGGVIRYVRSPKQIEFVSDCGKLSILLVDTRVPGRNSKALIQKVGVRLSEYPTVVKTILDSIDNLSKLFLERRRQITIEEIGTLMEINHHLLGSLGVGHEALDTVCRIASRHGCWAKLTGAGGGGCALVLLPVDFTKAQLSALKEELLDNKFQCYESQFGGVGMKFHPDKEILLDTLPSLNPARENIH